MRSKRFTVSLLTMTAIATGMLLVGAGCAGSSVAIQPNQANDETALQAPSADAIRQNAQQYAADQQAAAQAAATQQPVANANAEPNANVAAAQPQAQPQPQTYPRPTSFPGVLPPDRIHDKQVTIHTAKGDIVFDLYDDQAPMAVSNFVALAESGFYDGLTFHRVVPGFVIQGGDPKGDGTGGPGYQFNDEPVKLDYDAGIVAMANSGPNTNGSQFFIVLDDQPSLPKLYTIFGKVTQGMNVVRSIAVGDAMTSVVVSDKK
jgi:cyclophilin family peptidyl-prolyl cis-trans isomerase